MKKFFNWTYKRFWLVLFCGIVILGLIGLFQIWPDRDFILWKMQAKSSREFEFTLNSPQSTIELQKIKGYFLRWEKDLQGKDNLLYQFIQTSPAEDSHFDIYFNLGVGLIILKKRSYEKEPYFCLVEVPNRFYKEKTDVELWRLMKFQFHINQIPSPTENKFTQAFDYAVGIIKK